jgi:superfamily II DNA or RNA helicase
MSYTLRDYQEKAVDVVLSTNPYARPILCAPTGSGKTIMQAFSAKQALDNGRRTAILTPRAEIFDQTHSALREICGQQNVTALRRGHTFDPSKPVQVVSWPTLVTRLKKSDSWLPDTHYVHLDEAHLMAAEIGKVMERYREERNVIGWSATPARKNGKGLGKYFTRIDVVTTVKQLVMEGHLAPCDYWGGKLPDLQGVKTQAGDYVSTKLSERCAVLVGDVVDNWLRLARERQTIVFAVDIAHAEALTERFLEADISCAAIHTRLTDEKRDQVVEDFKKGFIQVLVNVTIASYGFDSPEVSCIVAARPTKSLVLWLQMLGRGMRPAPGKDACMVLDHADNTRTLGHAEDIYEWELSEADKGVRNKTQEAKEDSPAQQDHTCQKCNYMFSGTRECPRCGWEVPFSARDVAVVDADLVRIGKRMLEPLGEGWPSHEMFYRMLRHHAARLGKDSTWAWYRYREKVGHAPLRTWKDLSHVPPVKRVENWIKWSNLKYVKGRARIKRSA